MNNLILFMILFSLLLVEEKTKETDLRTNRQTVRPLIFQSIHLLWQIPFLVLLYHFVIEKKIPFEFAKDWGLLFLFPAAFALGRLENTSSRFFLVTFGMAFLILNLENNLAINAKLLYGIYLSAGVVVFQILFLGLWEKIKLSRIPKPINGLSLLFVVAMMTVMAMGRLLGILS